MVKEEVYKLIYELAFYVFLFKAENRGQASKPQEVEVKSLFQFCISKFLNLDV